MPCEACKMNVTLEDLSTFGGNHRFRACPRPCPRCHWASTQEQLEDPAKHDAICLEMPVACTASQFSCKFVGARRLLESHIASCPIAAVTPALVLMQKEIATTQGALAKKDEEIATLRGQMQSLRTETQASLQRIEQQAAASLSTSHFRVLTNCFAQLAGAHSDHRTPRMPLFFNPHVSAGAAESVRHEPFFSRHTLLLFLAMVPPEALMSWPEFWTRFRQAWGAISDDFGGRLATLRLCSHCIAGAYAF